MVEISKQLAPGLVIGHFVLYISGRCLTSELYVIGDNRGRLNVCEMPYSAI